MLNEFRKHYTSITKREMEFLNYSLQTKKFVMTNYCGVRVNERRINTTLIDDTIKFGEIIEMHYKDGDIRLLLRKQFGVYSMCVVVSLCKDNIITVYKNSSSDNHRTLDTQAYDTNVDILALVKQTALRAS